MGYYLMKADKEHDLYVNWSTYTDCPIEWGTKQEMLDAGFDEERLEHAEERGTSSFINAGSYNSNGHVIYSMGTDGPWYLNRKNLYDFLIALGTEDDPSEDIQQAALEQYAELIKQDD